MNWYTKVLQQYVDFNGRARRKEYWMFVLFNMIFAIVAITLDNVLGLSGGSYEAAEASASVMFESGPIYMVYSLAVLLPSLAVSVRRLHDVNKSGWWLLISLIPIIGGIWLLILFVRDSQAGKNQYGPNPKGVEPMAPIEA